MDSERPKRGKLTEGQVREIKKLLDDGQRTIAIADTFGVSERTIRHIKSGKYWSDVTID